MLTSKMSEFFPIPNTVAALEGKRFYMETEELEHLYVVSHVAAKDTKAVSVLVSFDGDREDEAFELDAFLLEVIEGRFVPL